jgi:hypothetical protein
MPVGFLFQADHPAGGFSDRPQTSSIPMLQPGPIFEKLGALEPAPIDFHLFQLLPVEIGTSSSQYGQTISIP